MQSHVIAKGIVKKRAEIYFLLFTFMICTAVSQAQTISLTLREEPIEKAFNGIESQSAYRFIYSKEAIRNAKPVNLQLNKASLNETLSKLFSEQPLTYSLEDSYIMVKVKEEKTKDQNLKISGIVTDEDRNPLQGATILMKGTTAGTRSNAQGEFSLEAERIGIVVISFVGRETEEVAVGGRDFIAVHLRSKPQALDETIIQAYGTTTRRVNTGDISKVSAAEIQRQPVSNVLAALEGRVPGMMITQSTGLPGSSLKVQLRGRTAIDPSITDDQPLFIIDGIPYAPNNGFLNSLMSALGLPSNSGAVVSPGGLSPFALINPDDIESVEVLKDADATAIYGSRGADGVVLITTKKGKAGKTAFNLNVRQGFSEVSRTMNLLNTPQYLEMRREAFRNDGVTPTASNAYDLLLWDTTRYTDFTKLLIGGKAQSTDVDAAVSGGTVNDQFLIGGSYHKETTVFPGNLNDKRAGFHINMTHASSDKRFKILFTASYFSDVNNLINADLTSSLKLPPNFQVYDSAGNIAWNEGGVLSGSANPTAYLNQTYRLQSDNLLGNLQLTYNFKKNLSMKVTSGFNNVLVSELQTNPLKAQNPMQNPIRSSSFASNNFKSWIVEPQVEYNKPLHIGTLNLLVGSTWQNQVNDRQVTNASGFIDDALLESVAGATSVSESRSFSRYRYEALFARLNFNSLQRYILNVSARRDGSSRFGPDKQFANFGALGAAWIFSKEKFSSSLPFLSFGKLRGSLGITGNDKIGDYLYLDTWGASADPYQGGPGLVPLKLFNPDFHWEKTVKLEGGVELGFLNDRLLLTASYYRNRSSNQLVKYKMPSQSGFGSVIRNFPALVQNSGLEISASTTNVKTKSFSWSSTFNVSIPKNRLLSFPGLATSTYGSLYVVGQPLNLIYGYKYAGVDPATGLYIVVDQNKDGAMNSLDYQVLGSLDPKYFGGFGNNFQYKSLSLDVFIQFTQQTGRNYLGNQTFVPGTIYNIPVMAFARWQKPGDQSDVQRYSSLSSGSANNALVNFRNSDGIYSDASFARLKNVSISYNLSKEWMRKIHFNTARIYLSGQNLLTFTNYKGGDPETQTYLRLPPLKTICAGVQFSF